jgi:hypothetical protein
MCCCKEECTVILEVTTSSTVMQLPESNRIRNGVVRSIRVPRPGSLTLYTPNGGTMATEAVLASSYLSLVNSNGTEIVKIGLIHLMRDYNDGSPFQCRYDSIDPTQSKIILGSTSASGYSATAVIPITFGLACTECGIDQNG